MRLEDTASLQFFALIAVLLCSVGTFLYVLSNPFFNWDMLGYAASLVTLGDFNPQEAHASLYAQLQGVTSASEFESMVSGDEYRETMYTDVGAFFQQVPYYKIRVLYLGLVTLVSGFGVDTFTSMHYLSAFFAAAIPLTLYLGLKDRLHSIFWLTLPFIYCQISLNMEIFRYGIVDMLAFFFVALINICFVRQSKWMFPLLALSVLVRTDLLIYVALVLCAQLIIDRKQWPAILAAFITALAVFIALNQWAGNYGWSTLFYFVFVSDMLATHPETYASYSVTISDYLSSLLEYDWVTKWFWLSLLLGVVTIITALYRLPLNKLSEDSDIAQTQLLVIVAILSIAYIVAHYLVFPKLFIRFFFGQCLMMHIALFGVLTMMLRQHSIGSSGADLLHQTGDTNHNSLPKNTVG